MFEKCKNILFFVQFTLKPAFQNIKKKYLWLQKLDSNSSKIKCSNKYFRFLNPSTIFAISQGIEKFKKDAVHLIKYL